MCIYMCMCVCVCVCMCVEILKIIHIFDDEEKDDDGTSLYDNYEREKNIRWKFDFVIRYMMKKWRKEEEVDKKGKKEGDDTWREEGEEERFFSFLDRFHFFIDLSVMWFFFFFKYKPYWRQKYEIIRLPLSHGWSSFNLQLV